VFTGLVDLASAGLGGTVLATNDDFFASKDNLVSDAAPVFLPDEYTERGKWMDGWESRRKRTPGYDWAILELGAPGILRGFDIDTSHFLGNHPPYASIEALCAPGEADAETLAARADWVEVLGQVPLRAGSQNLFSVVGGADWPAAWTHLRLNIYPDGGVARLRAYGEVVPDWAAAAVDDETRPHLRDGEVDVAALVNGGRALACSDMFFGPMNNLLLPGRAANMGGGWETRRRRGPGSDWIVVRLGARATIGLLELDTNHFKGNYPDRASVEMIDAPGARITDLVDPEAAWRPLLPMTKLSAHTRHFFREQLHLDAPATHVRLSIFPDGGVSRLRAWGRRPG
jgi:allantoicase